MDADNNKLSLIYKYFPFFKDIEETVPVLERMGLSFINIRELFLKGNTTLVMYIANPDTGKVHMVVENCCCISVELRNNSGEFSIYVNKVPYKEYFRLLDEQEANIQAKFLAPDPEKNVFVEEYVLLTNAIHDFDPELQEKIKHQVYCQIMEREEQKKKKRLK